MSVTRRCMARCPPWGFCATRVTPEQFAEGVCGSPNGIHGYDGYVTYKQIQQELREHGLMDLADRLAWMTASEGA